MMSQPALHWMDDTRSRLQVAQFPARGFGFGLSYVVRVPTRPPKLANTHEATQQTGAYERL